MNAIDTLFQNLRAKKQKAFMPFLTAGDPDLAFTAEAIATMAKAGAHLFEVGFPFSDPIADGPVIQASYNRALGNKLKLTDLFQTIQSLTTRPQWATPLVAMASYTLIHKKGPKAFIETAKKSGFSGAVLPDLPVEEAEDLARLAHDLDFHPILLVTPTTSPERIEKIVKLCRGFVYVVSVVGITGERDRLPVQIDTMLKRLRSLTDLPLCVGFGVSRAEHVRHLREVADGVIVGTALVRKLEQVGVQSRQAVLEELAQSVQELTSALNP